MFEPSESETYFEWIIRKIRHGAASSGAWIRRPDIDRSLTAPPDGVTSSRGLPALGGPVSQAPLAALTKFVESGFFSFSILWNEVNTLSFA